MFDSRPRVSIIIAAYNAVPFIERAIKSALGQTLKELEVIVVDDASTDGTLELVERRFEDSRVRLIKLAKNVGPAEARNVGIANANGDWISVLDADDAVTAVHLQDLLAVADVEGGDIIAGNFRFFNALIGKPGDLGLKLGQPVQRLDKYTYLSGARSLTDEADFGLLKPLFRAEFLKVNALAYPTDVRHGEDMELVLFALLKGAKFLLCRNVVTYLYTTRDSGQSRTRVDYHSQIRRTLGLRTHAMIKHDGELLRLLTLRAHAIEKFDFWRRWSTSRLGRTKVLLAALSRPAGREWLIEALQKRIYRPKVPSL